MTDQIDELTEPVTREDAQEAFYSGMAALGTTTTNWKPGAVVRTIIAIVSILFAAATRLVAFLAKSGFLPFASDTWLTHVARYTYGVARDGEFAPGIAGPNREEDRALRARALARLQPPPWADEPQKAYERIALTAKRSNGTTIAKRFRMRFDGKGNGYIYVAGPTGAVDGNALDPSTDLGTIDDQIQRKVAPLGFTAHTLSATPTPIDIDYEIAMLDTSGMKPAQVSALVRKTLVDYLANAPIGGYVIGGIGERIENGLDVGPVDTGPRQPGRIYVKDLEDVINSVRPEIFHVKVTNPARDVDIAFGGAPVAGAIVGTVSEQQQRVT